MMFYSLRKRIKVNYTRPLKEAFRLRNKGLKNTGLSKAEVVRLNLLQNKRQSLNLVNTKLFGVEIQVFNHAFWYLHSIEELFLDEVYKCSFKTDVPTIIDCGSNIGLSVIYFKRQSPKAKILAFEPDPALFSMLDHNIKAFGLEDVELRNEGIWTENTILKFNTEGELGGSIQSNDVNGQDSVEIKVSRLADLLNKKVDFLKIDIEGAEHQVFEDIKDKLVNVENLFLEFHGEGTEVQDLHKMLQWIHEAGFRYHIKDAWENQKHPFIEKRQKGRDLQLNIFCYRV